MNQNVSEVNSLVLFTLGSAPLYLINIYVDKQLRILLTFKLLQFFFFFFFFFLNTDGEVVEQEKVLQNTQYLASAFHFVHSQNTEQT